MIAVAEIVVKDCCDPYTANWATTLPSCGAHTVESSRNDYNDADRLFRLCKKRHLQARKWGDDSSHGTRKLQHFARRLGGWCNRQKITVPGTHDNDIFSLSYRANY